MYDMCFGLRIEQSLELNKASSRCDTEFSKSSSDSCIDKIGCYSFDELAFEYRIEIVFPFCLAARLIDLFCISYFF